MYFMQHLRITNCIKYSLTIKFINHSNQCTSCSKPERHTKESAVNNHNQYYLAFTFTLSFKLCTLHDVILMKRPIHSKKLLLSKYIPTAE